MSAHVPEYCDVERCAKCAPVLEARERHAPKIQPGEPTDGPWQVVGEGRGYDIRTVTAGLGEVIARRVLRAPDAYLLAAAPDLLAGYSMRCANCGCRPIAEDAASGCPECMDARNALSKARGSR